MAVYRQTIPLDATDEERGEAMIELAAIHNDLRRFRDDVTVSATTTPEGDEFSFRWPERERLVVDRTKRAA